MTIKPYDHATRVLSPYEALEEERRKKIKTYKEQPESNPTGYDMPATSGIVNAQWDTSSPPWVQQNNLLDDWEQQRQQVVPQQSFDDKSKGQEFIEAFEDMPRQAARSLASSPAVLSKGLSWLANTQQAYELGDWAEEKEKALQEAAFKLFPLTKGEQEREAKYSGQPFYKNPHATIPKMTAEAVGQLPLFMLPGKPGAIVRGASAVGETAGSIQEGGVKDPVKQIAIMSVVAPVQAGLENIFPDMMWKLKSRALGKNVLKESMAGVVEGFATEGITGAMQTGLQEAATVVSGAQAKTASQYFESILEGGVQEALGGAVGGGAIRGTQSYLDNRRMVKTAVASFSQKIRDAADKEGIDKKVTEDFIRENKKSWENQARAELKGALGSNKIKNLKDLKMRVDEAADPAFSEYKDSFIVSKTDIDKDGKLKRKHGAIKNELLSATEEEQNVITQALLEATQPLNPDGTVNQEAEMSFSGVEKMNITARVAILNEMLSKIREGMSVGEVVQLVRDKKLNVQDKNVVIVSGAKHGEISPDLKVYYPALNDSFELNEIGSKIASGVIPSSSIDDLVVITSSSDASITGGVIGAIQDSFKKEKENIEKLQGKTEEVATTDATGMPVIQSEKPLEGTIASEPTQVIDKDDEATLIDYTKAKRMFGKKNPTRSPLTGLISWSGSIKNLAKVLAKSLPGYKYIGELDRNTLKSLPDEIFAALNVVQKVFKQKVFLYESSDTNNNLTVGLTFMDGIALDLNYLKAHDGSIQALQTIGHEMFHVLSHENPEILEALDFLDINEHLVEERQGLDVAYENAGIATTEIYADIFGSRWTDPAFWSKFVSSLNEVVEESAVNKFLKSVRNWLKKILKFLSVDLDVSDYAREYLKSDVEASIKAIDNAWIEYAKRKHPEAFAVKDRDVPKIKDIVIRDEDAPVILEGVSQLEEQRTLSQVHEDLGTTLYGGRKFSEDSPLDRLLFEYSEILSDKRKAVNQAKTGLVSGYKKDKVIQQQTADTKILEDMYNLELLGKINEIKEISPKVGACLEKMSANITTLKEFQTELYGISEIREDEDGDFIEPDDSIETNLFDEETDIEEEEEDDYDSPTPMRSIKSAKQAIKEGKDFEAWMQEQMLANILRGSKGLSADDIVKIHPNIELKKDVEAKDIYGDKAIIRKGEKLSPYELKGNKVVLQDGEVYVVSRNQFTNINNNSIVANKDPFAPELIGIHAFEHEAYVGAFAHFTTMRDFYGNNYHVMFLAEKQGDGVSKHFPEVNGYYSHFRYGIKDGVMFLEEVQSDRVVPKNPEEYLREKDWLKKTLKQVVITAVEKGCHTIVLPNPKQVSSKIGMPLEQAKNLYSSHIPSILSDIGLELTEKTILLDPPKIINNIEDALIIRNGSNEEIASIIGHLNKRFNYEIDNLDVARSEEAAAESPYDISYEDESEFYPFSPDPYEGHYLEAEDISQLKEKFKDFNFKEGYSSRTRTSSRGRIVYNGITIASKDGFNIYIKSYKAANDGRNRYEVFLSSDIGCKIYSQQQFTELDLLINPESSVINILSKEEKEAFIDMVLAVASLKRTVRKSSKLNIKDETKARILDGEYKIKTSEKLLAGKEDYAKIWDVAMNDLNLPQPTPMRKILNVTNPNPFVYDTKVNELEDKPRSLPLKIAFNISRLVKSQKQFLEAMRGYMGEARYVTEFKYKESSSVLEEITQGLHFTNQLKETLDWVSTENLRPAAQIRDEEARKLVGEDYRVLRPMVEFLGKVSARAAEEVISNGDPTSVSVSFIGLGGVHLSQKASDAFVSDMTDLVNLLYKAGHPYADVLASQQATWAQGRSRLHFWNILKELTGSTRMQKLVSWVKAELEKPVLDEMISSGAFNNSNVAVNILKGYSPKLEWEKAGHQKTSFGRVGSNIKSSAEVQKSDTDTYSEYVYSAKTNNYSVNDDYFENMRGYITKYMLLAQKYRDLHWLRGIRININELNADFLKDPKIREMAVDLKYVTYSDDPTIVAIQDYLSQGKKEKVPVNYILYNLGYIQDKDAPGLVEWNGFSFEPPYIQTKLYETLNWMYFKPSKNLAVLSKAVNIPKRVITINPFDGIFMFSSGVLANTSPLEYPGLAYRFLQTSAKALTRGAKSVLLLMQGKALPYEGVDTATWEDLPLLIKHGFASGWATASTNLYEDSKLEKALTEITVTGAKVVDDFVNTLGGINSTLFEDFLFKELYRVAKKRLDSYRSMVDSNGNRIMTEDEAARRTASYMNTISSIVPSNLFGPEGPLYSVLLFTRGLTIGIARTIMSSDIGVGIQKATGVWGNQRYSNNPLNPFISAEMTRADCEFLSRYYTLHLLKIIAISIITKAIAQFALSFIDDDEEDEFGEKGHDLNLKKRNILNNPDPFSIRLPETNQYGARLYAETTIFPEVGKTAKAFGIGTDMKMPSSLLNYLMNRTNAWIGSTIGFISNKNWRTGQQLSDPMLDEGFIDRVSKTFGTMMPINMPLFETQSDMPFRTESKDLNTLLKTAQILGANIKPGQPDFYQDRSKGEVAQRSVKRYREKVSQELKMMTTSQLLSRLRRTSKDMIEAEALETELGKRALLKGDVKRKIAHMKASIKAKEKLKTKKR